MATLKWLMSVARAESGSKVQSGRGVTDRPGSACAAHPGAMRPLPTAPGLRNQRTSAGANRPSSSASLSRGTSAAWNRPVDRSTQATPTGALPSGRASADKVIGPVRVQHVVFGEGAGRDDAGDLALDQPLGQSGIFHLIADGDAMAGVQQFAEIGVEVLMAESRPSGTTYHGW